MSAAATDQGSRGRALAGLCLTRMVSLGVLAAAARPARARHRPGPPAALIGAVVLVGAARGAVTLLPPSSPTWGTTHYAALAGVLATPVTIAVAVAPWASTALAAGLDGSSSTLFTLLVVLIGLAAIPVVGGSYPPCAEHRVIH